MTGLSSVPTSGTCNGILDQYRITLATLPPSLGSWEGLGRTRSALEIDESVLALLGVGRSSLHFLAVFAFWSSNFALHTSRSDM